MFNYYSNLVFFVYILRLALVVLLVIVGSYYLERELGVAREEDSLYLWTGRWIGRLHDLEDERALALISYALSYCSCISKTFGALYHLEDTKLEIDIFFFLMLYMT